MLILLTGLSQDTIAENSIPGEYSDHYREAILLYNNKELESARKILQRIPGYHARFAEGIMNYELKEYRRAIPLFIQSTLDANTQQQRINSIFNLANCYFKLEDYLSAAELYENVLGETQPMDIGKALALMDYRARPGQKIEILDAKDDKGTFKLF